MASINEVTLLGNLGANPELRFTQAGTAVCTLRVATSRTYTKDGDKYEAVQWHSVVVWGQSAEWVADNKRRGDQVLIKGHLQTRSWEHTDKDGAVSVRYATEVVARAWDPFGGVIATYGEKSRGNRPPPPTDDDAPGAKSTGQRSTGGFTLGARRSGAPGTVGGPKTLGPPPADESPPLSDDDYVPRNESDNDIPF